MVNTDNIVILINDMMKTMGVILFGIIIFLCLVIVKLG